MISTKHSISRCKMNYCIPGHHFIRLVSHVLWLKSVIHSSRSRNMHQLGTVAFLTIMDQNITAENEFARTWEIISEIQGVVLE